jgi:hypothetical protein
MTANDNQNKAQAEEYEQWKKISPEVRRVLLGNSNESILTKLYGNPLWRI